MHSKGMAGKIHSFYDALMTGNAEAFPSLFTEDVTLNWGPFRFEGLKELECWAIEMKRLLPYLGLRETRIKTEGNDVIHEFTFMIVGVNRLKGRLPCVGRYSFKNGKIHRVSIKPSEGILEITPRDIMRLMLI